MRTKKILKKDAAAFCKNAAALITRLGFQDLSDTSPSHGRSQRIQTDFGIFIVHLPTMETWYPSTLEDINGRFQDTSVFGEWGSPERAIANSLDIALPSGKWNILHSDPNVILAEFERRMKRVNARPPSPEEREAWELADAEEAAKLAVWRGEMDKIMNPEPVSP